MECLIVDPHDVDPRLHCLVLRDDEARHAVRSLRMRVGEVFLSTDLEGTCYLSAITSIEEQRKQEFLVHASISQTLPSYNEPSLDVELIQGIPNQASKFEEIAERCTEIGISRFTPIMSDRVERNTIKVDRIEKILRSGCKQSYRARKPLLADVDSLDAALTAAMHGGRYIVMLHEAAPLDATVASILQDCTTDHISLVVGPEGGFTEDEVHLATSKFGAVLASLGSRRLRAETAAISAAAITMSRSTQ